MQVCNPHAVFILILEPKWNQEKNAGESNGKFGSISAGSSEKSKSRIGELVTEVLAENMSVRSDSER